MSQSPPGPGKTLRSGSAELVERWAAEVAVAAAVGAAFYLVGKIVSWGTAFQPDGVSLFWPPTGVSSGLLIVLGPRRRWPAVAGIVAASAAINYESWNNPWITPAVALCNVVEALTVAGLFTRYFGGADFPLDRARNIFGLLGAAALGAFASSLIATAALRLALGPSIIVVFTLQHWFASVFVGIVTVTPLVIGLADAVRHPPNRREYVEGTFALLSLGAVTAIIVALPHEAWEILLPVAWPFPILLWLAGRFPPIFAAAGAFLASNIIVWTTIFGIGHFGDQNSPLGSRVLEAQTAILFLAVSAYVLAALFAERRQSESLLAQSNASLERERENRLFGLDAITASIAHEIRQPLTAVDLNANAALEFIKTTPVDLQAVKDSLIDIIEDGQRTGKIVESIRSLFRKVDSESPVDINRIASDVLRSLHGELRDHGVAAQTDFASELPLINGNKNQLHQAIYNLAHNAVEAMSTRADRARVLRLITKPRDASAIVVGVQDSGPGIDPDRLGGLFEPFVTTKANGMGLGLAICREIVERHGGKLTASSDGKNGALFEFVLPVHSPEEDYH